MIEYVVAVYVLLHHVGGEVVLVNPKQIVSMHGGKADKGLYTDEVRCFIGTVDGKLVNVRETCDEVRELIKEKEK